MERAGRLVLFGALMGIILLFVSVRDLLISPFPDFEELKFYGSGKWHQFSSDDIYQIGTSKTVVMSYGEWKRYRLKLDYWFLGIGSILSFLLLPPAYRYLRHKFIGSGKAVTDDGKRDS